MTTEPKRFAKPIRDLLDAMRTPSTDTLHDSGLTDAGVDVCDVSNAADIAERIAELMKVDRAKKASALLSATRRVVSLSLALLDTAREDKPTPTALSIWGVKALKTKMADDVVPNVLGKLVTECARHGIDLQEQLWAVQASPNKQGGGFTCKPQGKAGPEAKAIRLLLGAGATVGVRIDEDTVVKSFLAALEAQAQAAQTA